MFMSFDIRDTNMQGLIYSFGEEGMQLVQSSKFFSIIFLEHISIGGIACTRVNLGNGAIFAGKF